MIEAIAIGWAVGYLYGIPWGWIAWASMSLLADFRPCHWRKQL
jgi:hypothetical protein